MRWVAGIRATVRAKLLCAFLLIAVLIIAVAGISLEILVVMGRHSRSLDEAHERVHWSQQIEHALALHHQEVRRAARGTDLGGERARPGLRLGDRRPA